MKKILTLCLTISAFWNIEIIAQHTESANTNLKASLFSSQERDSMQLWFYDRATVMGVKDEKREEFYNIILYHSYKMKALEKKDKGYTPKEIRDKFEELLAKQHNEVKAILEEKQYAYYLDTYDRILKAVYDRKGWN